MKVLVVGSGGREHALVWKLAQSKLVDKIYAAPGNAGISKIADCIEINSDNIPGLLSSAQQLKMDFTVVGPEAPLVAGIVNVFTQNNLKIFGPTKEASQLEGSKVFAKNILRKYGIPTANYRVFNDSRSALSFIRTAKFPLVIKADGLCGGKGVVIANSESEAVVVIEGMMEKKIFGKAGEQIIIEEHLNGQEASIIAITDGINIVTLESSQDHKRAYDGDKGPNTGGMGAYSPAPVASDAEYERVIKDILVPIVHAMKKEGHCFRGALYAGIMFTDAGPKVLEFNVRFGDPETQPLMMRMKSDIAPLLLASSDKKLADFNDIEWDERPAVCVVMASESYPAKYETGREIKGIREAEKNKDIVVFHAGTARRQSTKPNGKLITAGGRVLDVTAIGETLEKAQATAYDAVSKITFNGMHYRKDIGAKAIELISKHTLATAKK
ncbi:MAG: phosphoribosylamine--glycine ligase [Planctomycetes bacterium RBG_16_43_13]|nr:MAG: phosphoribosylamine--glycine ligase [Planctomycetes bacterium RBG_16_43_13]